MLLPVQEHLLIRTDRATTGFKGVVPNKGRYQARCDTSTCHHNHLGTFDIPEEAAQAYLQHREKKHPKELEKERAPPPPPPVLPQVQHRLLIRSDRAKTGYKGVTIDRGGYQANCHTAPCLHNRLGMFDTPEDAAQSYLQHWTGGHPEELERERAPPPPPPVLPEVQPHLLILSDKAKSGYEGVTANHGRYQADCKTAPCHNNQLGRFDKSEDAAQAYMQQVEAAVDLDADLDPEEKKAIRYVQRLACFCISHTWIPTRQNRFPGSVPRHPALPTSHPIRCLPFTA